MDRRQQVDYKRWLAATEPSKRGPKALEGWIASEFVRAYGRRFPGRQILEINTCGFTYLFDQNLGTAKRDDRTIALWGFSKSSSGPRDESRMKGFLGGGLIIDGRRYDKGHGASHAQDGFEDGLNLFPQRPDINRGHKCGDPRYREMERYCADHPETFFFSRMIYSDDSWVPASIEYGILKSVNQLEVREFPN